MKTRIFNEKTAKCKTCDHFTGTCCLLHNHIDIFVCEDDFCGWHTDNDEDGLDRAIVAVRNKRVSASYTGVHKPRTVLWN